MRNKFRLGILSLLAVVLLVGCTTNKGKEDGPEAEEVGEAVVIEHKHGQIELDKIPERLVVFDYGILDALDGLGLSDRVIGLPKKSVPEYMDKYKGDDFEDVGTLQEPNFELIYELEPDLIIIADRQEKIFDEFQEIAPTLYISIMDGEYMDLFKENMGTLAKIFHKEDMVREKVEEIEAKIKELNELASEKGGEGLFLMANDGELSVYGPGSRFSIVYNEFGIKPVDDTIDESTHGDKITYEYIVEEDPEYIFVMDRGAIVGGDTTAKDVMENDLIKTSQAYKNDKIIYLTSPVWYVSSGGITSTGIMVDDILNNI